MAYLSHFEHDVFVSYSHGDPLGTGILKKWTLDLVGKLEGHIRDGHPEFGGLAIWKDPMLDYTLQLSPQLEVLVKSSSILFIIMSPFYLKSPWCKKEGHWFCEQVQDHSGRVFIIHAQPTDRSEWPAFLNDLPGFPFHGQQNDVPYCWDDDTADRKEYMIWLGRLRTTLISRLRELRKLREGTQRREMRAEMQAAPRYTRSGPRRIYLHARTEDAPLCQEVRDRLSEAGFDPAIDMTGRGEELPDWRRETKNRIERAKDYDALALIRAKGDANFPFTLRNIGYYEREAIEQARGAPLPCAVLDRSEEELPIDVSGWGIEHFDLRNGDWRGEFRQWLDKAEAQPVAAQL